MTGWCVLFTSAQQGACCALHYGKIRSEKMNSYVSVLCVMFISFFSFVDPLNLRMSAVCMYCMCVCMWKMTWEENNNNIRYVWDEIWVVLYPSNNLGFTASFPVWFMFVCACWPSISLVHISSAAGTTHSFSCQWIKEREGGIEWSREEGMKETRRGECRRRRPNLI